MGQLNEFYDPSEFPIASIDFTPTKGGIRRRRSSKKRKRISKKRKSTRKRKSIRRK
jgi:hypothetical protein